LLFVLVMDRDGLEPWSRTAGGSSSFTCLTDEIALAI
jgi:hypothetical protein